jgi:hypothetical protein
MFSVPVVNLTQAIIQSETVLPRSKKEVCLEYARNEFLGGRQ